MGPSITRRRFLALLSAAGCLGAAGCGQLLYRVATPVPTQFIPNPALLPPASPDFVWAQVVDTVDDYFRIVREQPLQVSATSVLEGRIDTAYKVGGSLFEPWAKDSTKGFERLQSTLQSIRRRATIVVRPEPAGYSVTVQVDKELEDVDREQFSGESAAAFRHDGTILRASDIRDDEPATLGWISLGRDVTLEQQILNGIIGRVGQPDRPKLLHH